MLRKYGKEALARVLEDAKPLTAYKLYRIASQTDTSRLDQRVRAAKEAARVPVSYTHLSYEELLVEIATMKATGGKAQELKDKQALLTRIDRLRELNPMLGHRGCRIGITYPEITEMQARAIFEAACELTEEGHKVMPEVMIPLAGHVNEIEIAREIIDRVAKEVIAKYGVKLNYMIGTMIELPRAALTADEIALKTDFFSFGTNDLTQTTFGFSRDDACLLYTSRCV